jgi:hypothetical protein
MTNDADAILLTKITALLNDLNNEGTDNGEAMFLLGSAAASLTDTAEVQTWAQFRQTLDNADIIQLLGQIDTEGNRLLDEDKVTFAYAIQIVGMSLAAWGSDNPRLREGASLLDAVIETTLTNFRNYMQSRTDPVN